MSVYIPKKEEQGSGSNNTSTNLTYLTNNYSTTSVITQLINDSLILPKYIGDFNTLTIYDKSQRTTHKDATSSKTTTLYEASSSPTQGQLPPTDPSWTPMLTGFPQPFEIIEEDFTSSFTGPVSSPPITMKFRKTGRLVSLTIPGWSGNATVSTFFQMSNAIPAKLKPNIPVAESLLLPITVIRNGQNVTNGVLQIPGSSVNVRILGSTLDPNTFTAGKPAGWHTFTATWNMI